MGTQGALCPRRPRVPHAWVPGEDTELSPTAGHGTEKPLPAKHFPRGFPSPFSLLPQPIPQQGWHSPRTAQPRAPKPSCRSCSMGSSRHVGTARAPQPFAVLPDKAAVSSASCRRVALFLSPLLCGSARERSAVRHSCLCHRSFPLISVGFLFLGQVCVLALLLLFISGEKQPPQPPASPPSLPGVPSVVVRPGRATGAVLGGGALAAACRRQHYL